MADPRFFTNAGALTLARIAEIGAAEIFVAGGAGADPQRLFDDVAPLQTATDRHLSFLDNRKYLESFAVSGAGACFMRPEFAPRAPAGMVCLLTPSPYRSYALVAQAFYPDTAPQDYRAPTAVVDDTAEIGRGCHIAHGAVIGRHVKIGDGTRIGAYVVICDGVEIGRGCDIGAHGYLTHCLLGDGVRLHHGVCVGKPGFGFAIDPRGFVDVPQLGRVMIESGVHIGAHCTIDRGAGPDTVIGAGSRIDNLVQIGHNVQIGKACVIVAQVGISGSTRLDDFVMVGGQAGFAGHLNVGKGARISAQSGVMRDVPAGAEMMGSPAVPAKQYMRQVATLSRISASGARKKEKNDE